MIRPTPARLRAACAVTLTCVAIPTTTAVAADGGAGFGTPTGVQPAPATQATPATADGGTLLVQTASILGRSLHVQGTMAHGQSGRRVAVQTQRKDGRWVTAATATTTSGGSFDAVWRTRHIGRFPVRAISAPSGASAASATVTSTGVTAVTVYRQAKASFYGPGFFGKKTACGQVLQEDTLGVANRGLPCGTLVSVYYNGRSITVPVIDRGPFANGASWDLTSATAQALGFDGVDTIGAVRLPKAAATS
ncbi:septal ring lytic transglycosylase RlpA family protein [Paraconexibacter antarcticus]|uniref:Septal ring lytic transglycosylase RlpA family protein n=1 Tax=Paraconexibacter antarcticus TaxID=2949664 RepID=A0ABY5E0U9_9ACTN|nr:septal ring lytic transglycosylase RlpA family protein [Paraconexibacter antarcticus]UTI66450.1 septal ring lytic transglycosylase RlpA family protein [Paraconexibacter antarcticus]